MKTIQQCTPAVRQRQEGVSAANLLISYKPLTYKTSNLGCVLSKTPCINIMCDTMNENTRY